VGFSILTAGFCIPVADSCTLKGIVRGLAA
jgi:hypothetical protein